jgi:hypothetical protein
LPIRRAFQELHVEEFYDRQRFGFASEPRHHALSDFLALRSSYVPPDAFSLAHDKPGTPLSGGDYLYR